MREIKFRGKRVDNGMWVCGSLISNVVSLTGERRINGHMSIDHKTPFTAIVSDSGCLHEVIPETIGQFTGLYDKCGKEIYENDIILDNYGEKNIVIFYYNACGYRRVLIKNRGYTTIIEDGVEVIGSIHDNPQLLEEEGK